jgi:hypothetical protein
MSTLSPEQLGSLTKTYFRGEEVICPDCRTPMRVDESGVAAAPPAVGVLFHCPRCDKQGWDGPEERRKKARDYTEAEKKDIIDDHWKGAQCRCPEDAAILDVEVTKTTGATILLVRCKYCGANFQNVQPRG